MFNKKGNSIIEVVIVIVILTIGIVGTYEIVNSGQKLATTTENRIKAINIAREGLEAVTNIRDTNWIKFSSDYEHCWNVANYNSNCIGAGFSVPTLTGGILYQKESLWYLSGSTNNKIYLDNNGMVYQTGASSIAWDNTLCTNLVSKSCRTGFTRDIQINTSFPSESMKINSIVKWIDNSKQGEHTINLETTLKNWKIDL
ncbi:prepilin-type N-terminal cleavage/methylation domain-containing protein [Candidatus Gracilibacteria bacterium]|nr:prepilin-type N-terminal cleavage/methylation domain-containing protein [Candidatus Gracilibacteria bacterium]